MPQVTYQNQTYTFSASFNVTFSQEGDAHGNDNIFSSTSYPAAYQVLHHIDAQLLDTALAVLINGQIMSLETKIKADCCLEAVTAQSAAGQEILRRTLALLAAHAAFELAPEAALAACATLPAGVRLAFADAAETLTLTALQNQMAQLIANDKPIAVSDAWQKTLLLETYPTLQTPYAQEILQPYDDFEDVPVAVHEQYALPCREGEIYALFPHTCRNFSLTAQRLDGLWQVRIELQ